MSVSHRHKRRITVAGREYLWRVKHEDRWPKHGFPTVLEIIDPERRIKRRYGPLNRIEEYEWAHHGYVCPTGPWPEGSRRLIELGAPTANRDCTLVIMPRIVSRLIQLDFDLTEPPAIKRPRHRVIRPPRRGNGRIA